MEAIKNLLSKLTGLFGGGKEESEETPEPVEEKEEED
jgi:hypothetical protein